MAARYRTVERDQLMLLPHDLREWIPAGDIVHFIIEAAALVPVGKFVSNDRGTGDEQYHPQMMLALLLYSYSHGIFGSRRIERATWKDVSVRYICGNQHPDPKQQINLTDPDSRIMRKNKASAYEQAYNAQAVVDAQGAMLVVGARVTDNGPDSGELALDIEAVPEEAGAVTKVLADTGFANGATVKKLQKQGIEVLVALGRQSGSGQRRHDFRQFLLRGLAKVNLEWQLVACAYNLKRLAVLTGV